MNGIRSFASDRSEDAMVAASHALALAQHVV